MDDITKLYRVQREAVDAAAWQGFKNLFRRLVRLPIKKTAQEAEREVWNNYHRDRDFYDNETY